MRKVFCAVIAVVLVAGLLAGCGSPTPQGSGITANEILNNLEAKLVPIADQFQMTQLPIVELENGRHCWPVIITDTQSLRGRNYHIHVYTQDGKADKVMLEADKGTRTELNFALLSCYLYQSMSLPEMDAQAFYDHFALLTEEPSGRMTVDGWELWAFSVAESLTFSATYGVE